MRHNVRSRLTAHPGRTMSNHNPAQHNAHDPQPTTTRNGPWIVSYHDMGLYPTGWYAHRNQHTGPALALIGTTAGPFTTEAECVNYCKKMNARAF